MSNLQIWSAVFIVSGSTLVALVFIASIIEVIDQRKEVRRCEKLRSLRQRGGLSTPPSSLPH